MLLLCSINGEVGSVGGVGSDSAGSRRRRQCKPAVAGTGHDINFCCKTTVTPVDDDWDNVGATNQHRPPRAALVHARPARLWQCPPRAVVLPPERQPGRPRPEAARVRRPGRGPDRGHLPALEAALASHWPLPHRRHLPRGRAQDHDPMGRPDLVPAKTPQFPLGHLASVPAVQHRGDAGRLRGSHVEAIHRIRSGRPAVGRHHPGLRLRPHLRPQLLPAQPQRHRRPPHGLQRLHDPAQSPLRRPPDPERKRPQEILPIGRPCAAHLPLHRFHAPGRMEHLACFCIHRRPRGVRHGSYWLQGQMVGSIPRHSPQRLQRLRQQLVGRPLGASPTRLPQVRLLPDAVDRGRSAPSGQHGPRWLIRRREEEDLLSALSGYADRELSAQYIQCGTSEPRTRLRRCCLELNRPIFHCCALFNDPTICSLGRSSRGDDAGVFVWPGDPTARRACCAGRPKLRIRPRFYSARVSVRLLPTAK